MKNKFLIVISFLVFGLAGCASNPALAVKKAGLKTVAVESKVEGQQGMRYGVDVQGGLANMLAGAIVDSAGQKGIARMSEVMQSNGIVVADLVRDSVIKRLNHNSDLTVTNDNPDATFVISIQQFGFDNPGLSFSKKVPFVLLKAELSDRKGRRVWRSFNTDLQLTTKDIGATWDEYEAHPERLRADWVRQIDCVVEALFPETKESQTHPSVIGKSH